ncbi:MAG: extracellular solute-binding protein [Clostridia bacterium]|nr:extracellular solute-binding protein [Clostridia bacterium]
MKKIFKLGCVALGATMALGMSLGLSACGDGEGGGGSGSGNGGKINVHYKAGGFGNEVNKKLAADYKALTGVTVQYVASYQTGEIQSLLQSRQEKNDIVMPLLNIYQSQDSKLLEDLTDVYNATPDGESVAIKDKFNQSLYEYAEAKDGKRYQMFANNSVSALCYNIGTLDEAFGKGKWELPKTTNQLITMAGQLKSKGYYAFTTSANINYYWDYIGVVLWAQYEGLESYQKYFYGEYYDAASGEYKVGQNINDADGRRYALEVLGEIMKSSNGYMHQHSGRMGFTEAQDTFLSNGYVDDKKKVAFMVNGDWLENEMSASLMRNPQEIGMMRNPVTSKLAGKLSTIGTEAKLVEVVTAVDEGKTEVNGVSAADFEAVRQARLMCYTATPNYPIAIPAYRPEKNRKLAKDYLVYLYSDRAQKIIARELQGLTYPTSYVPEDSLMSDFVKTRYEAFSNDFIPVFPVNASPMAYRGGLGDLPGVSGPDKKLWEGASATSILEICAKDLSANWEDMLRALTTSE